MLLDVRNERREPWWFTVHPAIDAPREEDKRPAVRVMFKPVDRIAVRAARRAAAEVYVAAALPDDAIIPPDLIERAGDAMSLTLLMHGIIEWEGVGDEAGELAPLSLESDYLAAFLADPLRFEKLDLEYVRPWVLADLEKNGLSLSPNGISAGAESDIAGSSVRRGRRAAAAKTRKKG